MVTIRHATLTTETVGLIGATEWDEAHEVTGLDAGDVTGLAPIATTGSASDLSAGTVAAARMPALTGDITTSAGAVATTLATVNGNVGAFGSATQVPQLTVNAKGLVTAAANVSIAITGAAVSNTPAGNIAAITVQAAINELDTEKQPLDGTLTALAGASWSSGTQLLSLTAADTITLKTMGAAAGNILDKAAGDTLYQPIDSDLTAIAALTTTAYGRGLLALADAAALQTAAGTVIGTNVQAFDADLSALAGVTSAADKVPYFTGAGTASLTSLTSYGRSLIGGVDAAAVRLTLGLGTMATQDANAVAITGGAAALTAASSLTAATTADSTFQLTYTGASGSGASSRVQFLTASVPSGANHRIGTFNFAGYSTGTTIVAGCSIIGKSIGAWTSTDAGSYLQFNAIPAGSVTTAEVFRITGGVGAAVTGTLSVSAGLVADTTLVTSPAAGDNSTKVATTAYARAAAPNASYRTILDSSGSHIAGKTAATYAMGQGYPLQVSGTGTLDPPNIIHIVSTDFPSVDGLSPKLRIRANVAVNDVAPTGTYVVALHPVTRPGTSGAAGVCIYSVGAAVASSAASTISTPAADTHTGVVGSDFALPADGFYVIGVTTTGTVAVSSHMHFSACLQMRNA